MTEDIRIWGLGVGPGDPDLITLKALNKLREADVIAYPAPLEGDSVARSIVAPHLPGGQVEIPMRMAMVAERFPAEDVYARAEAEIGGHVAAGRSAVVLCEGDPFFYGSFMYLFARLAEKWPVGVVPGVSSLTACAAQLGMPLASRNDTIAVVPAPLDDRAIEALVGKVDAAVIVKVGRHLGKVRGVLDRLGLLENACYIERATMTNQRILALDRVDGDRAPYFSMILVHRRGKAWHL